MLGIILIVVLLLLVFGAMPGGPYPGAANWGYAPSGLLGTILIIVLILFLIGRL